MPEKAVIFTKWISGKARNDGTGGLKSVLLSKLGDLSLKCRGGDDEQ